MTNNPRQLVVMIQFRSPVNRLLRVLISVILLTLMPFDNETRNIRAVKSTSRNKSTWLLNNRAWAFQEYLLSPRHLVIEIGGPVWQYQTQNLNPVVPSKKFFTTDLQRLPDEVFSTIYATLWTPNHQYLSWNSLVKNYSSQQTTYPSDGRYAIAGIVS